MITFNTQCCDDFARLLIDPSNVRHPSALGAWILTIILGCATLGSVQLFSALWRVFRKVEEKNETHELVGRCFIEIFCQKNYAQQVQNWDKKEDLSIPGSMLSPQRIHWKDQESPLRGGCRSIERDFNFLQSRFECFSPKKNEWEGILASSDTLQSKTLSFENLSKILDETLISLVRRCSILESLSVDWCDQLTSEGIAAIAPHCPLLRSFSTIGCKQLTDEGLEAFAIQCHNLHSLSLSFEGNLKGGSVARFFSGSRSLRFLSLHNSGCLGDERLSEIANACNSLELFEVFDSSIFSDKHVETIVGRCPDLKSLTFFGCLEVTDRSMKVIAKGCNYLESLNVSGCTKISYEGILAIAEKFPNLKNLSVVGCNNLESHHFETLSSTLSRCTISR